MPADLVFTGERYIPGTVGEIAYEHWHRYAFARAYVAGKRVADVACGEGYGSALLASAGASVVGIDIAADAIAHARSRYAALANLSFEEGSAAALPLPDASLDAVVSFETIEHLPRADQSHMLAEFARVLGPDGIVVLSTPNPAEYSVARNYRNPFHFHEPERSELTSLLGKAFPAQLWFRQRRIFASAVWNEAAGERFEAWTSDAGAVDRAKPPAAMYFIVVAARSEASLPPVETGLSLFADGSDAELRRMDEQAREVIRLDGLLGEMRNTIGRLDARVQTLEEAISLRDAQLVEVGTQRDGLISQLRAALDQRNALASQLASIASERDAIAGALSAVQQEIASHVAERAELERTIAYRQSLRWWVKLPWFRAKRLLRDMRRG